VGVSLLSEEFGRPRSWSASLYRATVEAHARSEGDEVKSGNGALTVINRFDKVSGTWTVLIRQFCDDHLFLITKARTSELSTSAFVDTLHSYIKERGNPTLSLNDAPQAPAHCIEYVCRTGDWMLGRNRNVSSGSTAADRIGQKSAISSHSHSHLCRHSSIGSTLESGR
jgi:hypothetical protein